MCCPVESLDYIKVASTMKPIARAHALAAFAWQSSMGNETVVIIPRLSLDETPTFPPFPLVKVSEFVD